MLNLIAHYKKRRKRTTLLNFMFCLKSIWENSVHSTLSRTLFIKDFLLLPINHHRNSDLLTLSILCSVKLNRKICLSHTVRTIPSFSTLNEFTNQLSQRKNMIRSGTSFSKSALWTQYVLPEVQEQFHQHLREPLARWI